MPKSQDGNEKKALKTTPKKRTEEKVEKTIKSIYVKNTNLDRVNRYIAQNGGSFSDIVDISIELFFEALERGNNKVIESLGLENPENSILIPIMMYINMKGSTFVQVMNLHKRGDLVIKTITDKGVKSSKQKYVVLTDKHPDFHLAKTVLLENAMKSLEKQFGELNEKFTSLQLKN